MPRPAYFICSADGAIDQATNKLSFFNVLESITLRPIQPNPSETIVLKPVLMRMVACWLREEGDTPDVAYEGQIVAHFPPPGQDHVIAGFERFFFTAPVHRMFVAEYAFSGFPSHGVLTLECRIRRIGEQEWNLSQRFPILLLLEEPPAAEAEAEPSKKGPAA